MELERDELLTIEELDEREVDALIELDTINEEFEFLESDELAEDLIELKARLDLRREEYVDFYENNVKGVIKEFMLTNDLSGAVSFEARIKRDKSVKNSLERKEIELDDLKDYLGLRFIAQTREDAYTVAGLFMTENCLPLGKEDELKDDGTKFDAYETRDYFKRPKIDRNGRIQYTGIHIFLEKDGKKFEMQIHDIHSYENANLTHEEYKMRKCIERTSEEINLEELIQTIS